MAGVLAVSIQLVFRQWPAELAAEDDDRVFDRPVGRGQLPFERLQLGQRHRPAAAAVSFYWAGCS